MDQPWTPRPKPEQAERLERRVEFSDYATTRDFLDEQGFLEIETPILSNPTQATA